MSTTMKILRRRLSICEKKIDSVDGRLLHAESLAEIGDAEKQIATYTFAGICLLYFLTICYVSTSVARTLGAETASEPEVLVSTGAIVINASLAIAFLISIIAEIGRREGAVKLPAGDEP